MSRADVAAFRALRRPTVSVGRETRIKSAPLPQELTSALEPDSSISRCSLRRAFRDRWIRGSRDVSLTHSLYRNRQCLEGLQH